MYRPTSDFFAKLELILMATGYFDGCTDAQKGWNTG